MPGEFSRNGTDENMHEEPQRVSYCGGEMGSEPGRYGLTQVCIRMSLVDKRVN